MPSTEVRRPRMSRLGGTATRTCGACRLSYEVSLFRTRFRCFAGRGRVAMSLSAGADRGFEVSRGDRAAHWFVFSEDAAHAIERRGRERGRGRIGLAYRDGPSLLPGAPVPGRRFWVARCQL
jgi:hypothetical protein